MNNTVKPLFSDHYLTHRITETSEWNEDVKGYFDKLQSLYQLMHEHGIAAGTPTAQRLFS